MQNPGQSSPQQHRRGPSSNHPKRNWRPRWGDLLGKAGTPNIRPDETPMEEPSNTAATVDSSTLASSEVEKSATVPETSGADRQLLPSRESNESEQVHYVGEVDHTTSMILAQDHSMEQEAKELSGFLQESTQVGIQRGRSGLVSHASSEGASSASTTHKSNKGSPGSRRRKTPGTSTATRISSPRSTSTQISESQNEEVNNQEGSSPISATGTRPLEDSSEGAKPVIFHHNALEDDGRNLLEDDSSHSEYGLLNDMGTPRTGTRKVARPPRRNPSISSFTACSMPLSPCSSFNSKDLDLDLDSLSAGSYTERTKSSSRSMPSLASYSSSDFTTLSSSDRRHSQRAPKKAGRPASAPSQTDVIPEETPDYASSFTSLSVELNEPQPTSELTLLCNMSNSSFLSKDVTGVIDPSVRLHSGSSTQASESGTTMSMPSLVSISSSDVTSSSSSEARRSQTNKKSAKRPKVPIIPEDKPDNSASLTSLSVDLNEPQPASELTLLCNMTEEVSSPSEKSSSERTQSSKTFPSPLEVISSSDSNEGKEISIDRNFSVASSDSKKSSTSHSSKNPASTASSSSQNLQPMLSPTNSGTLQSFSSPTTDSRHSTISLLGQDLIKTPDLDNWSSFNSGSMVYSDTSDVAENLDTISVSSAKRSVGTTGSGKTPSSRGRRSGTGTASVVSASSTVSPKSRSLHSLEKKKPAPYDGVLLNLVDSMHGSGSTTGNFNESLSSFNTTGHSTSFGSRRGSFASVNAGSKHSAKRSAVAPRPDDYVSSASSTSSFFNEEASMGTGSKFKSTIENKKPLEASRSSVHSGKAPRRRSDSSGESSSVRGSRVTHPPHKQPRRHSIGTQIPSRTSPLPSRRGSVASDSGASRRHNEPTPKRGNSLSQYISRMERGDSGSFSGNSSQERHESLSLGSSPIATSRSRKSLERFDESRSLSSLIGSPSELDRARKTLDRRDCPSSPVSHRGVRCESPLQTTRKLSTEDLKQARFSAPPRLGRIRSQRRRIVHIANHLEAEKSVRSHGSSGRLSTHSQRSQRSLSGRNSEDVQGTPRSLPPRSPGQMRSPLGKPPVDPAKERTVRHGNRSVDLVPEIADIKQGRRRSWTNSTSERRYRIVGLPPFVEDNEDDLSVSSGSSSDSSHDDRYSQFVERESMSHISTADSMGRMSWIPEDSFSSHKTMQHDESPLPPRHRHVRPTLRTILSEASMSSVSQARNGESRDGKSQGSSVDIEPMSRTDQDMIFVEERKEKQGEGAIAIALPPSAQRTISDVRTLPARISSIASATSAMSNTSYDLQPVHLVIPASPDQPSINVESSSPSAMSVQSQSSASDDSTQLPLVPPLYRMDSQASSKTAESGLTYEATGITDIQGQFNLFLASTQKSSHDSSSEETSSSSTSSRYGVSSDVASGLFDVRGDGLLRHDSSASSSKTSSSASSASSRFQVSSEEQASILSKQQAPPQQRLLRQDSSEESSSSSSSSSKANTSNNDDDDVSMEWFPGESRHKGVFSPRNRMVSPPDSPFTSRSPSFNENKDNKQELGPTSTQYHHHHQQQQQPQMLSTTPTSSSPASQAIWDKLTLEKERQKKLREKLRQASPIPMIHSQTE